MHNDENDGQSARTYPVFTWVLSCLAIALVGATVFSLVQLVREQRNVRDLAAARDGLNAALNQTRSQLQALETKLDEEIRLQIHCFQSEDCLEGLNAFFEKRKPNFKGY